MSTPLPGGGGISPWPDGATGNLGLWYNKFCDQWVPAYTGLQPPPKREDDPGDGRMNWLQRAVDAATRQEAADGHVARLLAEHALRQWTYVDARHGRSFAATTATRLVSGLGRAHPVQNGFRWHHTLGVPCLDGSGLKGLVGEWCRDWGDDIDGDVAKRVLGSPEHAGSVDFLTALPTSPPKLTIDGTTPHLTEYYRDADNPPADWYSPAPVPWLAVDRGVEFQFALVPSTNAAVEDADLACLWLRQALATLGAGARTFADRGRFDVPGAEEWS